MTTKGWRDMWMPEELLATERRRDLLREVAPRHHSGILVKDAIPTGLVTRVGHGLANGRRALGQGLVRAGELVAGVSLIELERA
jgi:hypothetical protein